KAVSKSLSELAIFGRPITGDKLLRLVDVSNSIQSEGGPADREPPALALLLQKPAAMAPLPPEFGLPPVMGTPPTDEERIERQFAKFRQHMFHARYWETPSDKGQLSETALALL